MERSMESREGMRERIVPENERAMRLFPGDSHFSTDAVILLNRHRTASEDVDRKDAWYMLPINTEMSGAAV
jgi:hypothetical protein